MKTCRGFSRNRSRAMMIAIFLFAIVSIGATSAYACRFWVVLNSQGVQTSETLYYSVVNRMPWIVADQVNQGGPHDDGWSVAWWNNNNDDWSNTIRRHPEYLADFIPTYSGDPAVLTDGDVGAAYSANAKMVLCHARKSGDATIDNPHPFFYNELLGNDFFFIHNGTIYESTTDLKNTFDISFAALDLFKMRPHVPWGNNFVDTETYAALTMKYFMAAENYYWTPTTDLPGNVEFGLNMAQDILDEFSYNSLNCVLTNGDKAWMLFDRFSNTDAVHTVSYYSPTGVPERAMYTSTDPGVPGFAFMAANAEDQLFRFESYEDAVQLDLNSDISLGTLKELRVNSNSTGDQTSPSIAANPVDGSFMSAWVSTELGMYKIMGRAYNQMGLSETLEIVVNDQSSLEACDPKVAFSDDGTSGVIVWRDKPKGVFNPTRIVGKTFTWAERGRQITFSNKIIFSGSIGQQVAFAPSVAFGTGSNFAVVWAINKNLVNTGYELRYSGMNGGVVLADNQFALPPSRCNYNAPDICHLSNNRFAVAFAKAYWDAGFIDYVDAAILDNWTTIGTPVNLVAARMEDGMRALPSVTRLTTTQFAICHYRDRIYNGVNPGVAVQIVDSPAGTTVTWNRTIQPGTGSTFTQTTPAVHTDIVNVSTTGFWVTFDQSITAGNRDIKTASWTNPATTLGTASSAVHTSYAANDQTLPTVAYSPGYGDGGWYVTQHGTTGNPIFNTRRMVLWQVNNQDGSGWGVAGQFRGLFNGTEYILLSNDNWPTGGMLDDFAGNSSEDDPSAELTTPATPVSTGLESAYPNPFNPTTTIRYTLSEDTQVMMQVFDISGRLVRTLVDGSMPAGSYSASFTGSDLATGMYFVRMNAGKYHSVQKILLTK